MEGLMFAAGSTAFSRSTVHRRGWCMLYLRLIMLVSMTTADPPAEDWHLLASMSQQPLEEVSHSTDSPSALQPSSSKLLGQSSEVGNTFSPRPITDPPKASENDYSHTVFGLAIPGPEPLPVPASTSSDWDKQKGIGFEDSPRQTRNVKAHHVSSHQGTDSSGIQLSITSPKFSGPDLNIPSAELESPEESPFPSPELHSASGDQVEPSRRIRDFDHLYLSHDLNIQNDANPDVYLLNPSHALFENHHVTSYSTDPTMGPPGTVFITSSMNVDYGSGDYLETGSFVASDSLVTNIPSEMYDFEDSNSVSYDTSFPTRVVIPLSTRHLSPSPTSAMHSTDVTTFPNLTLAVNHSATINVNRTAHSRQITTSSVTASNLTASPLPPTSVPNIMSHLPIYSPIYSDIPAIRQTAVPSSPTPHPVPASLNQSTSARESSDADWPDITIEPTDVLLPDMNSLEYYTIQLSKGTENLPEQKSNHTSFKYISLTPLTTTHVKATNTDSVNLSHMLTEMYGGASQPMDNNSWTEESSTDTSVFDSFNSTLLDLSEGTPHLVNSTWPFLDPSVTLTSSADFSTSLWDLASTPDWISSESVPNHTSMSLLITVAAEPDSAPPNDTDIYWFANSSGTEPTFPTEAPTSHILPDILSASDIPTGSTYNSTFSHPVTERADQNTMGESSERPFITVETPSTPVLHDETTVTFLSAVTTKMTEASASRTLPTTVEPQPMTTLTATPKTTTVREYLCSITEPDTYLVRVGFQPGSTSGYAKAKVREILKMEFNRSVELQVVKAPPDFVFRAVSGPVIYTAASVINALRKAVRSSRSVLTVSSIRVVADLQYHVHSVLQFVPSDVDVHTCTFSERVEKGLTLAFAEVRRRSQESTNFTVHVLNITQSPVTKAQRQLSGPVDLTFVVYAAHGYILGSEVSALLRQLSLVEFSYYMGYPVQQIAEPFHYPELNTTQLLRSSWVKTVLLGVAEGHVSDRIFQATMERRLAVLLGEVLREELGAELSRWRRFRRATSMGNSSVQVVQTTRPAGSDNPLEMIYFVEAASGERLPADTTAGLLNLLEVQHAAIVLGYRIRGVLAQPVEKQVSSASDMESTTTWIIVGVVVPVVLVVIIITVLYWKLCRTDKLEFQPDAVSAAQQRQKSSSSLQKSIPPVQRSTVPVRPNKLEVMESVNEDEEEEEEEERRKRKKKEKRRLQPPSVKGFDFAKLHLGQHSKDDLVVIQEPLPLPAASKETGSGETVQASTPKSKGSSTKASRSVQRKRGRISPSDADSVGSDPSSERETPEENPRQNAASTEARQQRKTAANGLDGPPAVTTEDEQASSASMFEHVDRISRAADVPSKRFSSSIQLIALQPMPTLAVPRAPPPDHAAPGAKINKEVALRQKSEIEHHRNKIRLRAKRKGHYDFPAMDDVIDGLGDPKEQDRIYQKAQMQIDKILEPDVHMPPLYTEPKKSGRERRSPRQKKRQHVNGDVPDADRDRLITTDSDGTYKKYPGVNNIAYVSDPDQGPELNSPSPTDDVFLGPASPPPGHAPPPPPYLPPQASIEEARLQMHTLLDDAFALVSPSSQGSNTGVSLPAAPSSPPSRGPPPWGPSYAGLGHFPARYAELGLPPSTVQALLHRSGLGSRYPLGDAVGGERLQAEVLYSSRGGYMDELPSSARPRPVGGSTGAQLHHLNPVSMSSVMAEGRSIGGLNWGPHHEEDFSKPAMRDPTSRNGLREPTAPPAHLDSVALGYPGSAPPEEYPSPSHSSASLIKAIREELMRLSQKQAAVSTYHS
ncbi:UPF0606 protein KIAA1549 isoform X2 [Brachyhypopomus gauderio]|uniref:UPF0606 protein KIAA1549 isoform X2 n=1 Tax=Brachyhypopomus gauderio TaxID=698409 RepID=UPI00404182AB